MHKSVRASCAAAQKPLSNSMGILVVAMATEISIESGIAASRVREPAITKVPKTISTTPTNGPVNEGSGIPILAKRPTPRLSDEFDRELERRGLRFARYADDSNIYVRSRRAGERVMESLTRFIMSKLKLQVNQQKSAVARPWGKEVSRIQLHECRHTQTANRAESGGPVQGADPGTDEPEPRCKHRKNGRGTIPLSTGMDRLFREV
jgi:hypothetical protein